MRNVIIDTNIFILFILGQINPERISRHKRTSVYKPEDFEYLMSVLSSYQNIITCPNIITEVDNLLGDIWGEDRYKYLTLTKAILKKSIEKYIESRLIADEWYFGNIGITDSAILIMAKEADLLISGDSELCDYAEPSDIKTLDFKEYVNRKRYS